MKIHRVEQNSPEWYSLRLGKVTASEIDSLVSPEGKVRTGQGPTTYLYGKIAEKLTGQRLNEFTSFAMQQGAAVEAEALPWYSFAHNVTIDRVGFCTSDDERVGFSPDGLIGADGGIEIKSPQPQAHIRYLLEGVVPPDYVAQVQFSLYVSGRKWWKFVSYSRQFPALVVHVEPDPKMQDAIRTALAAFFIRFDEKLAQINKLKSDYDAPLNAAYEAKIAAWEKGGPIP